MLKIRCVQNQILRLCCFLSAFYGGNVFAVLPALPENHKGVKEGEWVDAIGAFAGEAGQMVALIILMFLFLGVAYSLLAKFGEWQKARAEISDLIGLSIVAGVVLIFITIVLTQSQLIFG